MDNQVTAISVEVIAEHLFNDSTGFDVDASADRYAEMLEEKIIETYPGVAVDVSVVYNQSGDEAETLIECADGEIASSRDGRRNDELDSIDAIGHNLYIGLFGDWTVESVAVAS